MQIARVMAALNLSPMSLSRVMFLAVAFAGCERTAQSPVSPDGGESRAGSGSGAATSGEGGVTAGGHDGMQRGGSPGSAGAPGVGSAQCAAWNPVTSWQAATGSGTVVSIGAGPTAGSRDVAVAGAGGAIAHIVLVQGGLPLPLALGDAIEVQVARSPGFQFGLTLTITKNSIAVLYMSDSGGSFDTPPVPLAPGPSICSVAEACGIRSQNVLLAFDGARMLNIGQGEALDVGAFRVLNDGTRLQNAAPGMCADWGGTYYRVAISRNML